MVKIIALGAAVLALVAFASSGSVEQPADIDARIEIVEDITTFKATHPNLELIQMKVSRNQRQQIVYSVGNRVAGDRLVGSVRDGQSWSTPQDITLTLSYPQSGVGAVVSYVQVVVDQSSNQGQGYVVAGGIGQRYIQLVIEAYSTSYFSYNASIYGK